MVTLGTGEPSPTPYDHPSPNWGQPQLASQIAAKQ